MTDQARAIVAPMLLAACEEALKLDAEATPGPWITSVSGRDDDIHEGRVCSVHETQFSEICRDPELDDRPRDRAFIASARELLPLLALALANAAKETKHDRAP